MHPQYYIVVNNQQQGPFSKEELKSKNLTPDTLIWRAGMPQWIKTSDFPEVADILVVDVTEEIPSYNSNEDNGWYAMIDNRRVGPATITELIALGTGPYTPVWHSGMTDWANASTHREFAEKFGANTPPGFNQPNPNSGYPNFSSTPNFSQNPQYGQQPNFSQNPQYGQQSNFGQDPFPNRQYGPGQIHTNWLPWAIGATVFGFLFSCFGAIFGIIGIIQANKANGFYQAGFDAQADQANNTAKIMTIIGYVLAGVGLLVSGFMLKSGGIYSYL